MFDMMNEMRFSCLRLSICHDLYENDGFSDITSFPIHNRSAIVGASVQVWNNTENFQPAHGCNGAARLVTCAQSLKFKLQMKLLILLIELGLREI